jgi:uncharacterized protein YndB with AHSA1/START domain
MSVIEKRISIRAPRKVVWRYFSDADLLAAWLMRNNFSGLVGDEFQFFAQSSTDWNGRLNCKLLEFDAHRRIAFTWDANNIEADTVVTIELSDQGDGTDVRLIHANFEHAAGDVDRLIESHDAGWQDHLTVLKRQAEEESGAAPSPEPDIDWSEFQLHVAIQAEPGQVIEYWSTIHGMEKFFVEMMRITGPDGKERKGGESAQAGDDYIWRWHNGRCVSGKYLSVGPGREVRFSFGDSIVAVSAAAHQDGSVLRLRQFNIPDTEEARMHIHANCRAAWVYFLTVLKILLEHGVDGRDKTRETGASFATHFDPAAIGVDFQDGD